MRRLSPVLAGALLASLSATAADAATFKLQKVAEVSRPVYVTAPRGDKRLFVVQATGTVRIVRHGRKLRRPFLDIRRSVLTSDHRGLHSIAFAPDYRRSGRVFFEYVARDDTVRVDEIRRSADDPNRTDPSTRRPVVNVGHAGPYHHGGQVEFGPDGGLYVSTGVDGTPALAQNPGDLHGKILRINTHVRGALPEIYALGLRNPWRFSFDERTGALAIADVGEMTSEEVDYLPPATPAGANFGYPMFEGFRQMTSGPAPARYVPPVFQELHSRRWCAIVGGYVVRDRALGSLFGRYLYGDLCTGTIYAAGLTTGRKYDRGRPVADAGYLVSFGEDGRGHVYVADFLGKVFRLTERRP